jgi:hypothetical protein
MGGVFKIIGRFLLFTVPASAEEPGRCRYYKCSNQEKQDFPVCHEIEIKQTIDRKNQHGRIEA